MKVKGIKLCFNRTTKILVSIPCLALLFLGIRYFDDIRWAIYPKIPSTHPGTFIMEKKARELSGWGATRCAGSHVEDGDIATDSCAINAFENKQPFRVFRSSVTEDSDGKFIQISMVGNSLGEVFILRHRYKHGDSDFHLAGVKCLKPRVGTKDYRPTILYHGYERLSMNK